MVEDFLALFNNADESAKHLVENFAKRAGDALARDLGSRFSKRVKCLWTTATERQRRSGRTFKRPRDEAVITISKHGGSEERLELRDAYVNLAARAMTEDEWDHDFEAYAEKLSTLRPGDISILALIVEVNDAGEATGFVSVSRVSELRALSEHQVMGAIDRLEKNELAQVVYDSADMSHQSNRAPGEWFCYVTNGINTAIYKVAPTVLGTELLHHVAALEGSPGSGDGENS